MEISGLYIILQIGPLCLILIQYLIFVIEIVLKDTNKIVIFIYF